jgi:protein-S-isoprenylcysteine O-methyltransferase Ste14
MDGPADERRGDDASRRKPLLRHPFRRKNFRPRALALYAAGIGAIATAEPVGWLFAIGLALVVSGQALRLWATGYLLKTDELTTAGPYAHLRHPLYAGALLMGTGFLLMAGPRVASVVLPLGLVFYFGYYLSYKDGVECERLEALYGDAFRAYRDAVPALLPRWTGWHPHADSERPRWQLERVIENDEQTALAYAAIAAAALVGMGLLRGF